MPYLPPDSAGNLSKKKTEGRFRSKRKSVGWNYRPQWTVQQRAKDKAVRKRFEELGYCKGGINDNYPCLCGDYPDDHPVWWMGGTFDKYGNKKVPDHLFCLRCRKRVYEEDIAEAITAWKDMKVPRAKLSRILRDE